MNMNFFGNGGGTSSKSPAKKGGRKSAKKKSPAKKASRSKAKPKK